MARALARRRCRTVCRGLLLSAGLKKLQSGNLKSSRTVRALQRDAEVVTVAYRHYIGVPHEFFSIGAVLAEAKDAQAFASSELHKAFATPVNP